MANVFHMPDGTAVNANEAAELAAEAIRALNHLTGFPGLEYPSDVCQVLGSLSTLAARLPQALEQMTRFLVRQHDDCHISAEGARHFGRPGEAVAYISLALGQSAGAAHNLQVALDAAQQSCAGLSYVDHDQAAGGPA